MNINISFHKEAYGNQYFKVGCRVKLVIAIVIGLMETNNTLFPIEYKNIENIEYI